MDIDQYARNCHQLITVEKQVPVHHQSSIEIMSTRVVGLLARITELTNSEEKAWQTVAKLRVELETTGRLRLRVVELEEAARKVCDTPPGDWELTCNGEAFNELDALLPNNTKDTPKC